METWFIIVTGVAAVVAGAIASVTGFGIGSLMTPVVGARLGMQAAVALVAVPHLAANLLRTWRLRKAIDRRVLVRFGIASAAGGLLGAALHAVVQSKSLTIVFAALLIVAGLTGVSRSLERVRFGRALRSSPASSPVALEVSLASRVASAPRHSPQHAFTHERAGEHTHGCSASTSTRLLSWRPRQRSAS